jgi:antibiotic biosynthesis monooxygenase (ABM) superfamily enzyme
MPFGLDIKSLIVGVLFAWFVIPWVTGMMNRGSASRSAPTTA